MKETFSKIAINVSSSLQRRPILTVIPTNSDFLTQQSSCSNFSKKSSSRVIQCLKNYRLLKRVRILKGVAARKVLRTKYTADAINRIIVSRLPDYHYVKHKKCATAASNYLRETRYQCVPTWNDSSRVSGTIRVNELHLDGYDFARVDFHSNEHGIVFDEVPSLDHLMGNESRKTETEGVRLATRPLEVLPCWIGYKAFDDIARFLRDLHLIEYGERHTVREWPPQQGIVLSGKDLYVYGNVTAFAGSVSV